MDTTPNKSGACILTHHIWMALGTALTKRTWWSRPGRLGTYAPCAPTLSPGALSHWVRSPPTLLRDSRKSSEIAWRRRGPALRLASPWAQARSQAGEPSHPPSAQQANFQLNTAQGDQWTPQNRSVSSHKGGLTHKKKKQKNMQYN